jgi:D-3-phosphoglycerate dehydrogenase
MTILISASSFGQVSDEPLELLKNKGILVIDNPYGRKLSEDEIITLAKGCDGIIAGVEPITARVMEALPMLRCISRVGTGTDNVDVQFAKQKGIVVVNTPDAPARSVAEFTLAVTLSLMRKIPQADSALRHRSWGKYTGTLVLDKIVGVIGLGRIGKLVAELFRGIGNPVIGYGRSVDEKWAASHNVQVCDLDTLLQTADIITLHIPLSANKKPVIAAREFELIKSGAYLVNVARGGVVDELVLYKALTTGKLSGAAVDVFTEEPYTGPLSDLENTVLTPHIGSSTREGRLRMEYEAANNLITTLENWPK